MRIWSVARESTLFIPAGGVQNYAILAEARMVKALKTVSFSKVRLEGRALEHALAGHGGHSVRMRDERSGRWMLVTSEAAKLCNLG